MIDPKEQHHNASGTREYELAQAEEENEERMTTIITIELKSLRIENRRSRWKTNNEEQDSSGLMKIISTSMR